jgi:hypothetical protein
MAHAVVHDNDESPADLGWRLLLGVNRSGAARSP